MIAFEDFNKKFISAPIVIASNWREPFEVMCDANGVALDLVLWKRCDRIMHPIYYTSKALNVAHNNYTVMEQELHIVVFAFEKFLSYLIGIMVIVHTHHSTLRYLMAKKDAKTSLIRWCCCFNNKTLTGLRNKSLITCLDWRMKLTRSWWQGWVQWYIPRWKSIGCFPWTHSLIFWLC